MGVLRLGCVFRVRGTPIRVERESERQPLLSGSALPFVGP